LVEDPDRSTDLKCHDTEDIIKQVFLISNVEYPISNTEGKQRVFLRVESSVKFGAVIFHRPKRLDHSTFLVGHWIFGDTEIATVFTAEGDSSIVGAS
jgi:hypothetical protein